MNQELLLENGTPRLAVDQVEWSSPTTVTFRAPQGMSFRPRTGANYELKWDKSLRAITITETSARGSECFFTARADARFPGLFI